VATPLARALYRSRQVLHALRPRIDAEELRFARALLTEAQSQLFFAMEQRDQRHALAVARRLRESGADDRDLLTAALLHDCGKGAVPVWLRVLYVLAPRAVSRLAAPGASGVPAAADRLVNHAEFGARVAEAAGAGALAVRLIAGRVLPGEESFAERLRAADDAS